MPEVDRNEYWRLEHGDGRTVTIGRRPEHYGVNVIAWIERDGDGGGLRSGACDIGMFATAKPAEEIARLLDRFRGEGFALIGVRTNLSTALLQLLRELDTLDTGAGVATEMIRNGWQVVGGGRYSKYSFRDLDALGVINPGNGFEDPVKILPIGRELARASQRRPATAGGSHA